MSTARIDLGKGLFATIDADDEELLLGRSWSVDGRGYVQGWMGGKNVKMHRVIMRAAPNQIVDHADGDKTNNQKSNLRFATKSENGANCKGRNPRSGFRGVYYQRGGRWVAKSNRRNFGSFDTPQEAAMARDNAMRLIFGKFARYNFPQEGELSA